MLLLWFSDSGKQILFFSIFFFSETMFSSFTIFITALGILPEPCCPKLNTAFSLEPNKAEGLTRFTWHFIRKNVWVFPQHACIIDSCLMCGPFDMMDPFPEDIFASCVTLRDYSWMSSGLCPYQTASCSLLCQHQLKYSFSHPENLESE